MTSLRLPLPPEQLLMIISGTAGTGKTHLVHALTNLLGSSGLLTASTGLAADAISCTTAANLPTEGKFRKLQGEALKFLQKKLDGKDFILVDEMSMIGSRALLALDGRLKEATGQFSKPFGGKNLILVGDFGQLPPVRDSPIFSEVKRNGRGSRSRKKNRTGVDEQAAVRQSAHELNKLFTTVVVLTTVHRQQGDQANFRDLLLRLRDGRSTAEDWNLLSTRWTDIDNVQTPEFREAVRLFPFRLYASFKEHVLLELKRFTTTRRQSRSCGGLDLLIFLGSGAKVMLTANVWKEVGLVNGARGE